MKFPHPLSLLFVCIAVAACLTWILPAGQYDRHKDEATGRDVVTAGSYRATVPNPISPFDALVAIPRGMADAGSVIFFAAHSTTFLRNVGPTPATFTVVYYYMPRTPKS